VRFEALQVWQCGLTFLSLTVIVVLLLLMQFALRWRTEDEVLSGAGETTCGNTRCEHHPPPSSVSSSRSMSKVPLTTLELPFGYLEHGKTKSALGEGCVVWLGV
jgi:hypothetical protein